MTPVAVEPEVEEELEEVAVEVEPEVEEEGADFFMGATTFLAFMDFVFTCRATFIAFTALPLPFMGCATFMAFIERGFFICNSLIAFGDFIAP
jgi:hypothetical protein